jgi:hypothetical protein
LKFYGDSIACMRTDSSVSHSIAATTATAAGGNSSVRHRITGRTATASASLTHRETSLARASKLLRENVNLTRAESTIRLRR